MGDDGRFDGGGRKASRHGGAAQGDGESNRPVTCQNGRDKPRDRHQQRRPQLRLPVDREINDDPGAECDCEPRYQAAGTDLGCYPLAKPLREAT